MVQKYMNVIFMVVLLNRNTGSDFLNNYKEKDLYIPVKTELESRGFVVKSEVHSCDVMALKDDSILIVELKKSLNLDVILQAVERKKITDDVYIAVFKKKRMLFSKRYKRIAYLLRRLEIGLFVVEESFSELIAREVVECKPFDKKKSLQLTKKRRTAIMKEFNERSVDLNTGGSVREKIYTAYFEKSFLIAYLLNKHGNLSIKELKELGSDSEKTSSILQKNFYGWFERVERGVYCLTNLGTEELVKYPDLLRIIEKD